MDCIIIEDQAPAQRILKKYINDLGTLNLLATFSDAIQALEFLKTKEVDLIFLDIHLPKISGIDLLKTLSHPPAVILTTAFSEYAVQSYELDVVDYLVKPFSFNRFVKAVNKIGKTSAPIEEESENSTFFIKTGYDYIKISSNDIQYINSDMDYTEIHLHHKKYISSETLSFWEQKLAPHKFIRIHKSYLVNLNGVVKVSGNQVFLSNSEVIPIGRAYKEAFTNKFLK